jgi:FkbM family methyltransferase
VRAVGFGVLRSYVRWAPGPGKRALVARLVEPRLATRPHAFTARTIHGARLRGDQRWVMPRRIYWFGVWEPLLSAWIERRLHPGDVFVDVGANMGYTSLLAARAVGPGGAVVAFEPAPETFAKLTGNLALNPSANVRAVQAAVGARETCVPFYRAPWNDAESSTVAGDGREAAGELSAAALAAMLAPHGFAPSWLPYDISAEAHLERRPAPAPVPGLPAPGAMAHLILSRG